MAGSTRGSVKPARTTDSDARGKNIDLCSDGTVNSGGQGHGTKVWPLYKSADVHGGWPRQITFYDDGVGTEAFKLFKILGGAFGWGLSRNIRQLYTFLVKHYRKGDRIYLFSKLSRWGRASRCLPRIKLIDSRVSPLLERRFHAVAIDDERHTFHPLMWNESGGLVRARSCCWPYSCSLSPARSAASGGRCGG